MSRSAASYTMTSCGDNGVRSTRSPRFACDTSSFSSVTATSMPSRQASSKKNAEDLSGGSSARMTARLPLATRSTDGVCMSSEGDWLLSRLRYLAPDAAA